MNGPRTKASFGFKSLRFVFIILLIVQAISIYFIWTPSLYSQSADKQSGAGPPKEGAPTAPPAPSILDLEQQQKGLEARIAEQKELLAFEKEHLSVLDNASRTLLTVAGIFTILLGVASWKALEDQRNTAQLELETQTNQIRAFREEIEKDFPMFGRIHLNFGRVLSELTSACQNLKSEDDTYARLTWQEKQRILFYENTVADTVLLDTRYFTAELSEIYRLLGVFYGSKYAGVRAKDQNAATDDLDRARFYFDRAIDFDSKRYILYFEAGHFTMYPEDSTLKQVSRDYFLRAAALGTSKQKARINLAILELEKRPDLALEHLTMALNCTEYHEDKSQPKHYHAKYLQACAYTQQAKFLDEPEKGKLLEKAVKLLEEVAPNSDEWIRRALSPDEGPDRDVWFGCLAEDSRFKDRFKAAVVQMESIT